MQDTRYINTYAVYSCVWRLWVVFLEHGDVALGIFKSPVCTYNQAWSLSLSASHYFCFLSERSGRRMPPAVRSALYEPVCTVDTYQVHALSGVSFTGYMNELHDSPRLSNIHELPEVSCMSY